MRDYIPAKRDLVAAIFGALFIPVSLAIWNFFDGRSVTFIVLSSLASLVGVLTVVALVLGIFAPIWRKPLGGEELIRQIDRWLGASGYTRGIKELPSYAHGIEILTPDGSQRIWIGLENNQNTLVFYSARQGDPRPLKAALGDKEYGQLQFDLHLEMVSFGAYYSIQEDEDAYTITYWQRLVVDLSLTASAIFEKLDFIGRCDRLILLNMGRHAHAVLTQPAAPPLKPVEETPMIQSNGDSTASPEPLLEGQSQPIAHEPQL